VLPFCPQVVAFVTSTQINTWADRQRLSFVVYQEAGDAEEAFERYKEEMADVAESIELATLDKEMAEEKVSTVHYDITAFYKHINFIHIC